jgi:hypothetical protein
MASFTEMRRPSRSLLCLARTASSIPVGRADRQTDRQTAQESSGQGRCMHTYPRWRLQGRSLLDGQVAAYNSSTSETQAVHTGGVGHCLCRHWLYLQESNQCEVACSAQGAGGLTEPKTFDCTDLPGFGTRRIRIHGICWSSCPS